MTPRLGRPTVIALSLALLPPCGAQAAARAPVELRAYVNDSCIVADEPFFLPASAAAPGDQAKFLPLLGLVIGKLAELFINHEIQASAARMKAHAARKDTHYAVSRHMNLYRVQFQPAPELGINAHLGCMTIVAATFKPEPAHCTAEYQPKSLARDSLALPEKDWKTSRTDASVENQLRRADVCVDGSAAAVYEAHFEFSADGTAYRLKDAGFQIASLLTTQDKDARRTTIYSLKIEAPGATEEPEILSSAWVNIGSVAAGAHSTGGATDAAPWLQVPPLSIEARRIFDEKTRVHQEVMGEIGALQRAVTRNQRQLTGLDQRIAGADAALLDGLKQERTRIAVQIQAQSAELDARTAEYQDLPRAPLEFMPVTIEVAVTESESEKTARLALADVIGKNSGSVASAVGGATAGLFSKAVEVGDLKTGEDAEPATELARTRDQYFDAVVDARDEDFDTNAGRADAAGLQNRVGVAKARYNEARRAAGLEPLR